MSVQNISGVSTISTKYLPENQVQTTKQIPQTEKKDGKKKLALALAGLAAAGIAAAVITHNKNNSLQNPKIQQEFSEGAKTVGEKIKGLVKKDNLPFDFGNKTILDKKGNKFAVKNTYDKYTAQYNGKDVIVEHKFIGARNLHKHSYGYAFIKDSETGEILNVKKLTLEGNEIMQPSVKKAAEGNIIRTTEKIADENGNTILKTYKNGKLHSTQTTVLNPDCSRQIAIEYADNGSKDYKKIIDIAADGTKKVTEHGKRLFDI